MENVTFAFCILLLANGFERFGKTRSDKVSQFFRGSQRGPGTPPNRSFGTTFWRLRGGGHNGRKPGFHSEQKTHESSSRRSRKQVKRRAGVSENL